MFFNRIKDEDQAVRSSYGNLRVPPPMPKALFPGGGLALGGVLFGSQPKIDDMNVSIQACGGQLQTREVGDLKPRSETQNGGLLQNMICWLPSLKPTVRP